ncbi:MAG: M28 family peptidase, partial [Xanthomonadales bacterium]|nr:M28 family peptidase [Xanthomonadales bacterium]
DGVEPPGLHQALVERSQRHGAKSDAGTPTTLLARRGEAQVASTAAAEAAAFASMLSDAIDPAYLQQVTEAVVGFGDNADGWRPGGSPANEAAADWIAEEMRAVGMKAVRKLPVPIDRWVFNGASVAVDGGPVFPASSWGGVPGTAPGGIHAEVLDLGLGRQVEYDNLGVDVTGKIVLVDWAFGDWWVNRHGHQATLEGAAAVIFYTGTTAAGAFYNSRDDSLFAFDGTYDDDWVPFVFVTRNAANDLRARIAAGPTFITLTSNIELTRAEDGGVGHNVVGMIPGSDMANEVIIFTGHHDAWFRGAADDATAMAAMLGIGKAVRDTNYQPRRTLVFLASTNEEYGYTDSYYEWLIGAWYAVTQQQKMWQMRGALALDFELLGTGDPGERLLIRVHSELFGLAQQKLTADPARTPFGTAIQNTVWANADHFTLTAAGIPGLYFNTLGGNYLTMNYHTDHDTLDRINFDYLQQNLQVINDIWVTFDRSTLPLLDFVAKAQEAQGRIAFVVDGATIRDLPGTDQAAQDDLEAAVARFSSAAQALEDRIDSGIPANKQRRAGRFMRDAERILLQELVALDVFDQYIMPHQQVQRDATRMQLALNALNAGNPAAALDLVRRTGLTSPGRHFAYAAYVAELDRHEPDFDRLQWGGQAHLAPYVDVWQEWHSINDKIGLGLSDPADYADEIAALESKLPPVYQRMNARLGTMAGSFNRAAAMLERAAR